MTAEKSIRSSVAAVLVVMLLTTTAIGGSIDCEAVGGIANALSAPLPPPRPADLDPLSQGKPGLVCIAHGWGSRPSVWAEDMKTAIQRRLVENGQADDWDVRAIQWSEYAGPLPHDAQINGWLIGRGIGKAIKAAGYENVHFIGNSAGAWLIEGAMEKMRSIEDSPLYSGGAATIHGTFLDSFLGYSREGALLLGDKANWTEQYLNMDLVPFTNTSLVNGYNIDVTDVNPAPTLNPAEAHSWPRRWYASTIDADLATPEIEPYDYDYGWGFEQSMEMGTLPSHDTYPRGDELVLPPSGDANSSPLIRRDAVQRLENLKAVVSDSGLVSFSGTELSIATDSTAWTTLALRAEESVDFLSLQTEFTSAAGAEGLLSVFWQGELIGMVDERHESDGLQDFVFQLPDTFGPGSYELSFRLDPFTETASSMVIGNVATLRVIPEPSTIVMLCLGAFGLMLHPRRGKR